MADDNSFPGVSFADDSTEFDAKAEFGKMSKALSALIEDMKFIKTKFPKGAASGQDEEKYPYPKPGMMMPKKYSEEEMTAAIDSSKKSFAELEKKYNEAVTKLGEFEKKATEEKASALAHAQIEKGVLTPAAKDTAIADYSKNFSAAQLDMMLKHVKNFSAVAQPAPQPVVQSAVKSSEPGIDNTKVTAQISKLEIARQDAENAGLNMTVRGIDEQIAALKKGVAA